MAFKLPPSAPLASTPGFEHEWDPYGPAVIVQIGTTWTGVHSWTVAQSMLCVYSKFFRRMLDANNPAFNFPPPGQPFIVRLPGDDPATFQAVLYYLENRNFFNYPGIEPGAVLEFEKIIDLFSFGEKKGMPLIQNAAADLFVRKVKYCGVLPDRCTVEYLWEKTEQGSKLRKMFTEIVRAIGMPGRHKSRAWGGLLADRYPNPDYLMQQLDQILLEGYKIRISAQMWNRMKACEWHVHEPGVGCELSEEAVLGRGRGEDDAEIGLERGGRGAHRGIARAWDSPSYYFG